ncbi:MAG: UDP-glucose/GDP-mannose dehydrogenase family protein [Rhodobacteraceae bacterium]|nr:UDP-glucose/GDP-mannose dehydrogenase family protein [Paracoccaceae bacterium]
MLKSNQGLRIRLISRKPSWALTKSEEKMRVTVFGCGYVGLVTGACLSELGHDVECIDIDADKVATLQSGIVPFYEPGIDTLLQNKNLSFSTTATAPDLCIIAVGTPLAENGSADLSQVFGVADLIAAMEKPPKAVVMKSTVPPGTSAKIAAQTGLETISNPEFLRQGSAVQDFMQPDRLVIGASSPRGFALMEQLYAPLNLPAERIVNTSTTSAELTKYAANVFLTTKLAFVNELALYCETVGADIDEVTKGIGLDTRIGNQFLQAGPGIGGSCFPKDIRALAFQSKALDHQLEIVQAVIASNDTHQNAMLQKIVDMCGGMVTGKRIAIFGVTFKANTDDLRNSVSTVFIPALQDLGAKITATDPMGAENGKTVFTGVDWVENPYEAAKNADVVVILTEWDLFKALDLARLAQAMHVPRLVDLRNIFDVQKAVQAGFDYDSIGRAGSIKG